MTSDIPEDHDDILSGVAETKDAPGIDGPAPQAEEADIINASPLAAEEPNDPQEADELSLGTPDSTEAANLDDNVRYPRDITDFRGSRYDHLTALFQQNEQASGTATLVSRILTVGSWENLLYRALDVETEISYEEQRIQDFLGSLPKDERAAMSDRLVKEENNTILLRTSSMTGSTKSPTGEKKMLTGDAALVAFANRSKGGYYRVPLYNTGITVDILVPTGNDIQTLLDNCEAVGTQLGASMGAHYFNYADQMIKVQIVDFIIPLIINSSYDDWKKKGKLQQIIKLPDLQALLMNLAAAMYKDGYDGFVSICKRPHDEAHPQGCHHKEVFNADLFKMITTRWPVLPEAAIGHMVEARLGNVKHSLAQIAEYQSKLGFEGEKITFDDITFTMRIPTISEHLLVGSRVLAEINNEIVGDNNAQGRYNQLGLRYMRSYLPWIAYAETGDIQTSEPRAIVRELEILDRKDSESQTRDALLNYVNKVQLTYVGYPVTPCPVCQYVEDTPSGMYTIDPFQAFFTLASRYLMPVVSAQTNS